MGPPVATTIDWATKVINVPRADMLLLQSVPSEIRQLNVNDFRMELNAIQSSQEGIWIDATHDHFPPVTVAGVDLARVVSIINGYTVTFEDGQYAVYLTGGNNNVLDVNNKNQVSVNPSNSAGLMDIAYMQAGAFDGVVAIDITSIYTGTTFPVGTKGYPVNNLVDAHAIGQERGLNTFYVMSSMTLGVGDFSVGHIYIGLNMASVTITVDTLADVSSCEFRDCTLQGVLDNNNIFRNCLILDITHVNGFIHQCVLKGTITLDGGDAVVMSCYSGYATNETPVIDMGGSGNQLSLSDYVGGLSIVNGTGAADVSSLNLPSGHVIFDVSVTAGSYYVRGGCDVTVGASTADVYDLTFNYLIDQTLLAEELTAEQAAAEHITDPINGLLILRNTVVQRRWEADAWQDVVGGTRYSGNNLEAVGQLVEVAWS
jgi:hypothetical protein